MRSMRGSTSTPAPSRINAARRASPKSGIRSTSSDALGPYTHRSSATGREEQTRRARRRHDVQRVPEVAEQLPQRRAEHHLHAAVRARPLVHLDAEQVPRRAVRAVGADEVLRAHATRVTGCIPQRHAHTVGAIVDGDELRSDLEANRRQRSDVPAQHRLEPVLGHRARRGRTDHRGLFATRIADRVRASFGRAREGRALPEPHVGIDAARADLVLEAATRAATPSNGC